MMSDYSKALLFKSSGPATFLNWLELQETVSPNFSVNLKNYQSYIKEWGVLKNSKKGSSDKFFSDLYINLLREITLNFSTEEERRFIVNFDFTKTDNLDTILPFFIEKIKSICLYYCGKRDKLKQKISLLPFKGTTFSVQKAIKTIILEDIESGNVLKFAEGRVNFPSLSSINKNLSVKVEEIYDSTDYFNTNTVYENVSSYGFNEIDPNLYIDFKESIINAINQYPLFLTNIRNSLSLSYNLSGNELYYLKERDFLNYIFSLSSEDLKLNLKQKLAPKYASCDFYYLSVGSTINDIFSGVLFTTKPLTGANTQNLSNRDKSAFATVQSLDQIYTTYEMGKFFIPSNTGVLQYNTIDKKIAINYKKLSPNGVYVFPDPGVVESSDLDYPIIYRVNLSWNKESLESGFKLGDVISNSYYQRFYPYESYSQDVVNQPYGLSLAKDNVDFWNGEKDSVWTDSDLWPGLNEIESLPLDTRLNSLLQDKGFLTEWYTDIYGNEFGLYKRVSENENIFNKRKFIQGDLYVKNSLTGLVSSANHFFNNIFLKYPTEIQKELFNKHLSFYLIKNVFVVETENYVIVDSYNFEFSTGKFLNTLLPGIYIPKYTINSNLEKYINSYYVESTNKLYLCFVKLLPSLSASNYKNVYPTIYELDVDSLEFKQKYPGLQLDVSIHTLSSFKYDNFPEVDIRYIEGAKFSYKEKFNLFNLTYCGYNLNGIPFYINEQFSISDGSGDIVSYFPILNKPYFYTRDINFSNPNPDYKFRFTGNYSEPAGFNDLENFNFDKLNIDYNNFHYNTKVNPVFINIPGSHYVHFDFDQYIFGNVYIGCENLKVTKIDNFNFLEFITEQNDLTSLRISSDEIWYKVRNYSFNNYTFSLSVLRPKNTNGAVLKFNASTSLSGFSGVFCKNLYSVYRNVKIVKSGTGNGIVTSDPFCLDCGNLCEFLYPINGTLTLIPSAGFRSVFGGWLGAPCQGLASNCFLAITDNTTITAIFTKIPEYTLQLSTNLPGTSAFTIDGKISCGNTCSAIYLDGDFAILSATKAPAGYFFEGFKGGPCGGNNPCGLPMTQNYYLTATYLSGNSEILLTKDFNGLEYGPILGRINNVAIELLDSNENTVCYNDGPYDFGSIVCSLSPSLEIYGFKTIVAPRNEFVLISANIMAPYVLEKYEGSPCQNFTDVCGFFAETNTYNITAFLNAPIYTINILNSGSGLFYTQSTDGNINCGSLSLANFRDKCAFSYLSGTMITLSGIALGASKMIQLNAEDYVSYASNLVTGDQELQLTFPVTKNLAVTAAGVGNTFRTLTIIKSGFNTLTTAYNDAIVTIDNYGELINVNSGVSAQTFNFIDTSELKLFPRFTPASNNYLYTIGSSALYYILSSGPGLVFSDGNPITVFQSDTVLSNSLFNLIPNPGNFPLFVNSIDAYVTFSNPVTYVTMTEPITAIFVYSDAGRLVTEENIDLDILTERLQLIYI